MATTTSVPDAKDALTAALAARSGLDGALVMVGLPAEVPTQAERIYFTGVEDLKRDRLGQQRFFAETYVLMVLVEVHQVDRAPSGSATARRAWEIVDEITATIQIDPELGGVIDESEISSIPAEVTLPSTEGWITRITVRIDTSAKLDG